MGSPNMSTLRLLSALVGGALASAINTSLPIKCAGDVASLPLNYDGCVNVDDTLDTDNIFLTVDDNTVGNGQYDVATNATYFFEEGFNPDLPYICESENVVCDDDTFEALKNMNCTNNISTNYISKYTVEASNTYIITDDAENVVVSTFGHYCMDATLRVGNIHLLAPLDPTIAQVCSNDDCATATNSTDTVCHNILVMTATDTIASVCSPAYMYYSQNNEETGAAVLYKYDIEANVCHFERLVTTVEFCEDGFHINGLISEDAAKNLCDCGTENCEIVAKMTSGVCPLGFQRTYRLTAANTFALFNENCIQIATMTTGTCTAGKILSTQVSGFDVHTERKVVGDVFSLADARLIENDDIASISDCSTIFYYLGFDKTTSAVTYLDSTCTQKTDGVINVTRNEYGLITVTVGSTTYYLKNLYSQSVSAVTTTLTQAFAAVTSETLKRCTANCSPNTSVISIGTVNVHAAPVAAGRTMSVRPDSSSLSQAEAAASPAAINFTPGATFSALIGSTIPGTTCTVASVYMGTYVYSIQGTLFSEVSFYAVPVAGCRDPKALDTPLKVSNLSADEKVAIQYPIEDSNFADIVSGSKSLVCKYYDDIIGDVSTDGVSTVVDSVTKEVDCIATHTTPFSAILEDSFVKASEPFICKYSDDACTTEVQCYPLFGVVSSPITDAYYYDVTTTEITVSVTDSTPTTTSMVFTASGQCVAKHVVSNVSLLTSSDEGVDGGRANNAVLPSVCVATAALVAATLF
eukprot:GDKJ01012049.1.p1 GENE.GDKJ01012049.1~~GDKJ01012049.1.p1  ORF type:complete len:752 (+),score=177.59 GDKJ01012049.1:1-2256(+)